MQSRGVYIFIITTIALVILNVGILSLLEERILNQHQENLIKLQQQKNIREGREGDRLIISFEEDGRFGNLLLETATLLLVGRRVNLPVNLLPQVAKKLSRYFHTLPIEPVDNSKHCVCTYCSDCLCSYCDQWQKIPSSSFRTDTKLRSNYVLLQWFDSNLVLRNFEELADLYRSLLKPTLVNQVQNFLQSSAEYSADVFVGVHVRRTDYVNWIQNRYKGKIVDEHFFNHCMDYFRERYARVKFFVTSDDVTWCRENIAAPDVVFPQIEINQSNTVEQDFVLLTQMNHTIYDYGSFGFWAAALAGGQTLVADNYSNKTHPLLAAIKRYPPNQFKLINVQTIGD